MGVLVIRCDSAISFRFSNDGYSHLQIMDGSLCAYRYTSNWRYYLLFLRLHGMIMQLQIMGWFFGGLIFRCLFLLG